MTIANANILVVGGSSGIGFGVARAALDAGATVTIASRSEDRLQRAAKSLGCGYAVLDTGDTDALETFFGDTAFDHIFCSAAKTSVAPVRELPLEDAYANFQSKFWGAYRLARAANIRDGGSLTLISGYLSVRPKPGAAIQSAINAGLEGLARGLALELAPIRVNCISPGLIKTEMLDESKGDSRQAMFDGAAETLPVGRVGTPENIATQALALMMNPYMSGATIFVDGGGAIA